MRRTRPASRARAAGRAAGAALAGAWLGGAALAGCAAGGNHRPAPRPRAALADSAWPGTLAAARAALAARDHGAAERMLAGFVARHPHTSAANEATYWWALVRVDPANRAADPASALPALDAYRAIDPPRSHAVEAGVFRALVARQDSLRLALALERAAGAAARAAASAAAAARAAMVPRDSLRVRDEELVRLRTEAAALNAELDRVRRRLTAPPARGRQP